jgi:hypothetical protein
VLSECRNGLSNERSADIRQRFLPCLRGQSAISGGAREARAMPVSRFCRSDFRCHPGRLPDRTFSESLQVKRPQVPVLSRTSRRSSRHLRPLPVRTRSLSEAGRHDVSPARRGDACCRISPGEASLARRPASPIHSSGEPRIAEVSFGIRPSHSPKAVLLDIVFVTIGGSFAGALMDIKVNASVERDAPSLSAAPFGCLRHTRRLIERGA